MKKIDSVNKVKIMEIDGKKVTEYGTELTVKNHWNWNDLVVLEFNHLSITVQARCLEKAIENSLNAHS